MITNFRQLFSTHKKETLFALGYISWGAVGFKRGCEIYNYEYSKHLSRNSTEKEQQDYINNYPWLHSTQILKGISVMCLYLVPSPVPGLFIIIKEINRLEINIRGLKKPHDYYDLF